MTHDIQLYKKLKSIGWSNREYWTAQGDSKFISTYAINSAIEKPKDWDAIALKCSNNPNHEMFGKSVQTIREEWSSRGARGQKRGIGLDDYINAKLGGVPITHDTIVDEKLLQKCLHFDRLYYNVLQRLHSYIGSELWLNSRRLKLSVRTDSLFTIHDANSLLIAEWKNNETISTTGWDYFQGPASHLKNTDINKFTIQTFVYKYIFDEYELFDDVVPKIFNITSTKYQMFEPAFDYDEKWIEELVKYTQNSLVNG